MDCNFLRTYRNRSYVQREIANGYETLLPPPALAAAVHYDHGSYACYDDSPISPMINCAGQASTAEVCYKNRFIPAFAKPSGAGYYDPKGRWVCTASKQNFKIANDRRYDIGVQFKVSKSPSTDTNASKDVKPNTETNNQSNNLLFCSLCGVSVTSALQMAMHLSGIKHKKKVQKTGAESTKVANEANAYQSVTTCFQLQEIVLSTVLQVGLSTADPSDVFVCRTPNGQFYCNVCNTTMINGRSLQQHLSGKRHLKAQVEEKAKAFLTLVNAQKLSDNSNIGRIFYWKL
uniref:C2H2-type domain-containing protein n=1 Tax=Glossina pallidipes TaxID=7398 RepID=A0A1A9Z9C6_GLOPL